MLGIYFSGTGNSKYVLEVFLNKLDSSSSICAIENKNVFEFILKMMKLFLVILCNLAIYQK